MHQCYPINKPPKNEGALMFIYLRTQIIKTNDFKRDKLSRAQIHEYESLPNYLASPSRANESTLLIIHFYPMALFSCKTLSHVSCAVRLDTTLVY